MNPRDKKRAALMAASYFAFLFVFLSAVWGFPKSIKIGNTTHRIDPSNTVDEYRIGCGPEGTHILERRGWYIKETWIPE